MPTKREREYYAMGFKDGRQDALGLDYPSAFGNVEYTGKGVTVQPSPLMRAIAKPKRKLSAWNKFVRANSKKKIFRYRDGKLNLKKMGVAFRKKTRR